MKEDNTVVIGMLCLLLASSGIAANNERDPSITQLPVKLVNAGMYKDGGTLRFDFLDQHGSTLSIFVDGKINSPTPGALYLKTSSTNAQRLLVPDSSVLASTFFDVLSQWLNEHYTKEQQKNLPTASPEQLTQDDFRARWILRLFEWKRPEKN